MTALPAVFVSHGSPMLILEDVPARRFLAGLGALLPRPEAVLVMSAHWGTRAPAVSVAARPETIHDFHGFPDALYQQLYPAPGAPDVAARAADLLAAAGHTAVRVPDYGLDHGAWAPLKLAYPAADIPVAQIATQPAADPRHHFALGAALRPLREAGVLLMGSGSFTHNLGALSRAPGEVPTAPFARAFIDWMVAAAEQGRVEDLLDYRAKAPFARENHPTDEHLLPFFFALGAATPGHGAERLHDGVMYGALAMHTFRFT
jgi:4,5-DOPA dioxygenase extradiol